MFQFRKSGEHQRQGLSRDGWQHPDRRFVIGGNTSQTVLIRATGPALAGFGLTGTLPTPVLTVYNNTGTLIATNTGWGDAPVINTAGGIAAGELQPATSGLFSKVGAFSLTAGSADSALALTLLPGAYTAQIADKNGQTGIAPIQIYEVR